MIIPVSPKVQRRPFIKYMVPPKPMPMTAWRMTSKNLRDAVKKHRKEFKNLEQVETPWIVKKKRKRFTKRMVKMNPMKNTSWRENSKSIFNAMRKDRV